MKKTIAAATFLAAVMANSTVFASGYRIPEQSANSTALSGAYVAAAHGADASYANPANMSWVDSEGAAEVDLAYINLSSIAYYDNDTPLKNGGSRTETFIIPQVHAVSPAYGKTRIGVSLVYPAGLSKRWDAGFPLATAQEFTLKVAEFNPSASYAISDKISAAAGIRAIHARGVVKSNATIPFLNAPPLTYTYLSRDMEGDATEFGYNLALAVRPLKALSIAATYRSKVDLDLEGDALLRSDLETYSGSAAVSVPLPEVITVAAAYTVNRTTIEFTWDRTKWSDYQSLDFNYSRDLTTTTATLDAFDAPVPKNWEDSDAFRLGITHRLTDQITLMAAVARDETPVPEQTLGFELPDSNATLYSLGVSYRSGNLTMAMSYLYDDKENRTVDNSNINGTFTNADAQLVTMGLELKF